jgi:hypothetical protein
VCHGAHDISSLVGDVYGFDIVIVQVEVLIVVLGRLKEIHVALIYGFSEV